MWPNVTFCSVWSRGRVLEPSLAGTACSLATLWLGLRLSHHRRKQGFQGTSSWGCGQGEGSSNEQTDTLVSVCYDSCYFRWFPPALLLGPSHPAGLGHLLFLHCPVGPCLCAVSDVLEAWLSPRRVSAHSPRQLPLSRRRRCMASSGARSSLFICGW